MNARRFHGRPGYSAAHFKLLANGGPDVPGAASERIARQKLGEQANAEMMAKFGPLTLDNAREAVAWQEARIRELIAQRP